MPPRRNSTSTPAGVCTLRWRFAPEPFGALLYHFHTRKLSFLKSPTIVEVVRSLADHATAREACAAVGVSIEDPATARLYLHALGALAASRMIEETP